MALEDFDSAMPSLADVMKDDPNKGKLGNMDDGEDGFDIDVDNRPFDPFAKDDQLENDPARQAQRKDEVVFEVVEDDDTDVDQEEDFKDTRKKGDPRKMSRLQREMKLKQEARDKLEALNNHTTRLAAEVTKAQRAEMHSRRNMGEMALGKARDDIQNLQAMMAAAQENGDTAAVGNFARRQAEAEAVVLRAEALIERYAEAKVNNYFYNPEIPEQLRDSNNGGTAKGKDWVDANAAWFSNPDKYGAEIAFAMATDKQLIKEGMKPDTDDYFNELTRRVALKMNHLEVYTADGRVARIGQRQRGGGGNRVDTTGSSANAGSSQSRRPSNQARETLSPEEQRMLRGLGIDTSNKDHLAELKRNRVK